MTGSAGHIFAWNLLCDCSQMVGELKSSEVFSIHIHISSTRSGMAGACRSWLAIFLLPYITWLAEALSLRSFLKPANIQLEGNLALPLNGRNNKDSVTVFNLTQAPDL